MSVSPESVEKRHKTVLSASEWGLVVQEGKDVSIRKIDDEIKVNQHLLDGFRIQDKSLAEVSDKRDALAADAESKIIKTAKDEVEIVMSLLMDVTEGEDVDPVSIGQNIGILAALRERFDSRLGQDKDLPLIRPVGIGNTHLRVESRYEVEANAFDYAEVDRLGTKESLRTARLITELAYDLAYATAYASGKIARDLHILGEDTLLRLRRAYELIAKYKDRFGSDAITSYNHLARFAKENITGEFDIDLFEEDQVKKSTDEMEVRVEEIADLMNPAQRQFLSRLYTLLRIHFRIDNSATDIQRAEAEALLADMEVRLIKNPNIMGEGTAELFEKVKAMVVSQLPERDEIKVAA